MMLMHGERSTECLRIGMSADRAAVRKGAACTDRVVKGCVLCAQQSKRLWKGGILSQPHAHTIVRNTAC